jgi:hypothetical protein
MTSELAKKSRTRSNPISDLPGAVNAPNASVRLEKTVDDRRDMFGGLDDVSAVTKNFAERTRIHARESF